MTLSLLLSLLGAIAVGGLAILGAIWAANRRGYERAQREIAEDSAENLRERAKVDEEIRNLKPDDALRRFDDSGWLSDDKR